MKRSFSLIEWLALKNATTQALSGSSAEGVEVQKSSGGVAGKSELLIAGRTQSRSVKVANSLTLGKRHPSRSSLLACCASCSACCHVYFTASPLHVEPSQVCPSEHRLHTKSVVVSNKVLVVTASKLSLGVVSSPSDKHS